MSHRPIRAGLGRVAGPFADLRSWLSNGAHVSLFDLARGCSVLSSSRGPSAHGFGPWGKPGSTPPRSRGLGGGSRLSPGRRFSGRFGALATALLLLTPAGALAAAP